MTDSVILTEDEKKKEGPKTVPIDHAVISHARDIPKGEDWHYYLCDMVRPVPIRQMVEFLDKQLKSVGPADKQGKQVHAVNYRLPYYQDLYLLENYFTLCITAKVDKILRRRLSDLFWVKKKVGTREIEQFITSLSGGDRFFKVGSPVIIPLVHRHYPGTIHRRVYVEKTNSHNYVVDFLFPVTKYQKRQTVTVNKDDLLVSYSRYNLDRIAQRDALAAPPAVFVRDVRGPRADAKVVKVKKVKARKSLTAGKPVKPAKKVSRRPKAVARGKHARS